MNPTLPHLASEFYLWLWWYSAEHSELFNLSENVGYVTLWVDSRVAFRFPSDVKVSAVMTGKNPSASLEAKAALAGGKVLSDLRVGFHRGDEERTFLVTLKGPLIEMSAVKLPSSCEAIEMEDGEDPVSFDLLDRMHAYSEASLVVSALYNEFSKLRTSPQWRDVNGLIRDWVWGGEE